MSTFYLTVGDYGDEARIGMFHLRDADNQLITGGTVELVIERLLVKPMTHHGGGVWSFTPEEGDISRAGDFSMEVLVNNVALPPRRAHKLVVRKRLRKPEPPADE